MTIEEAKELLLELQCETIKQDSDEMDVKNFEALNMAIEALQLRKSWQKARSKSWNTESTTDTQRR